MGQQVHLRHAHRIMRIKRVRQTHAQRLHEKHERFARSQAVLLETLPEFGQTLNSLRQFLGREHHSLRLLRDQEDYAQHHVPSLLPNFKDFRLFWIRGQSAPSRLPGSW
jgi:hypothetical protein